MIKLIPITRKNLIIDYRAREWCKLPYPDHPRGCPNYGIKSSCPPKAPLIEESFNLDKEIWLIIVEFNLHDHINHMKARHPEWSERQARCVLYWQPKVNKILKEACSKFSNTLSSSIFTTCPEALGVNVIQTVKNLGIPIHSRPKDIVFKVGLVGFQGQ
jgi:predicted metal-binding protein